MQKIVSIDVSHNDQVEKEFNEVGAMREVYKYLLESNTDEEILIKYEKRLLDRIVKFNAYKEKIASMYCPKELKGKLYNYTFIFDINSIKYEVI